MKYRYRLRRNRHFLNSKEYWIEYRPWWNPFWSSLSIISRSRKECIKMVIQHCEQHNPKLSPKETVYLNKKDLHEE